MCRRLLIDRYQNIFMASKISRLFDKNNVAVIFIFSSQVVKSIVAN